MITRQDMELAIADQSDEPRGEARMTASELLDEAWPEYEPGYRTASAARRERENKKNQ